MRFEAVDPALLRKCQQGDLAAFEQLCSLIQQDLYGYVYSQLRNHDDTDEVLQECLVRVFRHLPKLQDLGSFPWWIMRIALNQCHSLRSRSNCRALYPLEEEVEVAQERRVGASRPPVSPREAVQRKETMHDIETAIAQLPPRQREAILLFEVEDHSIKEIAQLLECSEGAVKFNLHEARKKLKEYLGGYLTTSQAKEERQ